MKTYLVERILAFLEKRCQFKSDTEKEKIRYILMVIIGECGKFFFLLLIFMTVNRCEEYVFAVLTVLITRSFAGGPHEKNSTLCWIHTILFFMSVMLLSGYYWSEVAYSTVLLFAFGTYLLFAPIVSKTRGFCSRPKKMRLKRYSIYGIFVVIIMMQLIPSYKRVMVAAIFLEMIEFYYLLLKERRIKKCGE